MIYIFLDKTYKK